MTENSNAQWQHRVKVRNLWPPSRFPASKTKSNAMTGFIITKFHELIRFFIKNFTRMSLKLEKPEKIRISFKCYLSSNKKFFLESPRHANGYQYAKIYLFHAFHDHFTLFINWKGMSYFIQSHGKYFKPIITACYQCASQKKK